MSDRNSVEQFLRAEPDLVVKLQKQREHVLRAVEKHQFRHKWFVRTLSTFFWATAAGAYVIAAITHDQRLLIAGTMWLLLGAIVLLQSRLKNLDLKIDGILMMLSEPNETARIDESERNPE